MYPIFFRLSSAIPPAETENPLRPKTGGKPLEKISRARRGRNRKTAIEKFVFLSYNRTEWVRVRTECRRASLLRSAGKGKTFRYACCLRGSFCTRADHGRRPLRRPWRQSKTPWIGRLRYPAGELVRKYRQNPKNNDNGRIENGVSPRKITGKI